MVALFTATLLLSASLIFVIQPMFAKMVLPQLGGAPAVWNTCVVFFQLTLLAGYAYTHLTVRWLGVRRQAALHLLLLALPLLVLPMAVGPEWKSPSAGAPVGWLLLVLAAVAGLPFFAVSTSAPLLQRWFAETPHPLSTDPYFLYAASNVGSLGALLAYPVAIEPFLPLQMQTRLWTIGYVCFAACVATCAALLWRSPRKTESISEAVAAADEADAPAVTWRTRGLWIALSAVPSSLMLSVTTYVSTDIAAVPLLWVIPLALYLMTFVIVFARRPVRWFNWLEPIFPLIVLLPALTLITRQTPPLAGIPLHFFGFFAAAMVCHRRLARMRPPARHLTEFYLWMSIGGAAGGLFNTLVAPLVFVTIAEYPLGLCAAALLALPVAQGAGASTKRQLSLDVLAGALVFGVTWGLLTLAGQRPLVNEEWIKFGRTFAIPVGLTLACWRRPSRFALAFGAVLLSNHIHSRMADPAVHVERTFFGQHLVFDEGSIRNLSHGTTSHGAQVRTPELRCEPTTYYARTGPIGQLFASFVGPGSRQRIGVIGLGTGSMAPYARPGQQWTFFEINPVVADFAKGRYFTFLTECISDYDIQMGDARQRLAEAPDASFDVLVFDAFSSDAIPVHLITLEAIEMYLKKLSPNGVLAFHISNRYLDLGSVLAAAAKRLGLVMLNEFDTTSSPEIARIAKASSRWAIMARTIDDLGDVARDPRWEPISVDAGSTLWTDDFTNIVRTIRWAW